MRTEPVGSAGGNRREWYVKESPATNKQVHSFIGRKVLRRLVRWGGGAENSPESWGLGPFAFPGQAHVRGRVSAPELRELAQARKGIKPLLTMAAAKTCWSVPGHRRGVVRKPGETRDE